MNACGFQLLFHPAGENWCETNAGKLSVLQANGGGERSVV